MHPLPRLCQGSEADQVGYLDDKAQGARLLGDQPETQLAPATKARHRMARQAQWTIT